MKIGFDAKRIFQNFTGLGNYSRYILDILLHYYPEYTYLLYAPRLTHSARTQFLSHAPQVSFREPSSSFIPKSLWRSTLIYKDLEKDKLDVFHGLSNELPLRIPTSTKRILTIHDLLFLRIPHTYKPIDRFLYNWKFRRSCEYADKIIAISKHTATDIEELYGISHQKIEVIYQACDKIFMQAYSQEKIEKIRQKYALPQDFILNVGTIEKRKNALLIVKALQMMPSKEIPLVIVGRSTPYKTEIETYIQQHRLQRRVIFLHQVPFEDLPLLYQAARLFVYPSIFEGFGIPIVEALYSGVPVIGAKGSCLEEAGGKESWYVSPDNPEELAFSIEKILTDTLLRQKMIEKGYQHAAFFDDKRIASQLMQVYQ